MSDGDLVEVDRITFDGIWGAGTNITTLEYGTFPMKHLRRVGEVNNYSHSRESTPITEESRRSTPAVSQHLDSRDESDIDSDHELADLSLPSYNKIVPQGSSSMTRNPDISTSREQISVSNLQVITPQRTSSMRTNKSSQQGASLKSPIENFQPRIDNRINLVLTAMIPYSQRMSDEIDLHMGDQLRPLHIYEDDWAIGINLTTGKSGIFPLSNCKEKFDSQSQPPQILAAPNLPIYLPDAFRATDITNTGPEIQKKILHMLPDLPQQRLETTSSEKNPISFKYFPLSTPETASSILSNQETKIKEQDVIISQRTEFLTDRERESMFLESNRVQLQVVRSYEPRLDDELRLYIGQKIELIRNFEDGWALGYDASTGITGIFPAKYATFTTLDPS
ncbi:hypothetical protein HK096_005405 [Nowakowskiella sp. JEL0078]|nr:hypothetical protein HK096_005405 [Nowakowskiella sp. JEL0078]